MKQGMWFGLASLNNSRTMRYRTGFICLGPGPGDSSWCVSLTKGSWFAKEGCASRCIVCCL